MLSFTDWAKTINSNCSSCKKPCSEIKIKQKKLKNKFCGLFKNKECIGYG